jgi:uncharacterized protein (TIGR01777 family)
VRVSQKKRIVIAGGNGFIGTALAREFATRGFEVTVLTRTPRGRTDGVSEMFWDGVHLGDWILTLDGAEALINLAGSSINCPHTPENLRLITDSRVNSVKLLAVALDHVKVPPRTWVQASAVGFYGDTHDHTCADSAPNGNGALAEVCFHWENAFSEVKNAAMRKVTMRMGFVLGRDGGALPVLATLVRLFLGGAAGGGQQYISWIHLYDVEQMFVAAVEKDKFVGVYNAVAPDAVTNADFMRELRRAFYRPWSPNVPEFAVRLGAKWMNGEPSLALISQRCLPKRMLEAGFHYQFPHLKEALRDLCRRKRSH